MREKSTRIACRASAHSTRRFVQCSACLSVRLSCPVRPYLSFRASARRSVSPSARPSGTHSNRAVGCGRCRHLDADEAVVLGAGLYAANLSTTFRLRKFGMSDGATYPVVFEVRRRRTRQTAPGNARAFEQERNPVLTQINAWRADAGMHERFEEAKSSV
jgi:hypothetical protein